MFENRHQRNSLRFKLWPRIRYVDPWIEIKVKLTPEVSHRSLQTAPRSLKSCEKIFLSLMGGLVLWSACRLSLIKVWSRSVRAEKFVPKSNGLDIRLFWFVMALLSDWKWVVLCVYWHRIMWILVLYISNDYFIYFCIISKIINVLFR